MPMQDTIESQVRTILIEASQRSDVQPTEVLDMSSIQVLKALSLIEKTFQIEVEDEEVFHGIFTSAGRLSAYVRMKLDEAE